MDLQEESESARLSVDHNPTPSLLKQPGKPTPVDATVQQRRPQQCSVCGQARKGHKCIFAERTTAKHKVSGRTWAALPHAYRHVDPEHGILAKTPVIGVVPVHVIDEGPSSRDVRDRREMIVGLEMDAISTLHHGAGRQGLDLLAATAKAQEEAGVAVIHPRPAAAYQHVNGAPYTPYAAVQMNSRSGSVTLREYPYGWREPTQVYPDMDGSLRMAKLQKTEASGQRRAAGSWEMTHLPAPGHAWHDSVAEDVPRRTAPLAELSLGLQLPVTAASMADAMGAFFRGDDSAQYPSSADATLHSSGNLPAPKHRYVWPPDVHRRFEHAVAQLGLKNAKPQAILDLMNMHGDNAPTRQHIKSHLQKYRIHLVKLMSKAEAVGAKPNDGGGGGGGELSCLGQS